MHRSRVMVGANVDTVLEGCKAAWGTESTQTLVHPLQTSVGISSMGEQAYEPGIEWVSLILADGVIDELTDWFDAAFIAGWRGEP